MCAVSMRRFLPPYMVCQFLDLRSGCTCDYLLAGVRGCSGPAGNSAAYQFPSWTIGGYLDDMVDPMQNMSDGAFVDLLSEIGFGATHVGAVESITLRCRGGDSERGSLSVGPHAETPCETSVTGRANRVGVGFGC